MKIKRTAILLTACLIFLTGCSLLPEEESLPLSPTYRGLEVPKYQTAVVTRGDLADTVKIYVNYQPLQTEGLFFQTAGLEVDAVYVKLGDQVHAGDVLLQLELGSLATDLENAQLDKEQQEMSLRQLGEREAQDVKRARINYAEGSAALEDALENVGKFIDTAVLAGLKKVYVIHGRGAGILRKGIREDLKHNKHVAGYTNAGYNEGGDGCTVVSLR